MHVWARAVLGLLFLEFSSLLSLCWAHRVSISEASVCFHGPGPSSTVAHPHPDHACIRSGLIQSFNVCY